MSAKKGFVLFKFIAIFLVVFVSTNSQAQVNSGDTAWILSSSALVLFMTLPGLALFYAGLVQSKNVLSVLCQHFGVACLMSIIWVIIGYSLAFSPGDSGLFGNLSKIFIELPPEALSGGIPEVLFAMFQMTFCIITPALVIGSYVERIKFSVVLIFSALWLIFVYCPVAFWVWGGGFLAEMGVKDFAGGIVVHTTAGLAALVVALVLGKRRTFGSNTMVPPHSPVLTMIGASMLWVGWFGFNGGSALAADQTASMAILVTHIAASIGAFSWILIEWFRFGKPSLVGMATGMVAGLATITPAAGTVGPEGALLIGLLAGIVCFYATQLIKSALKIDDSLDVFPVHGVGGMLGIIMLSIVGNPDGFLGSGASGISESGALNQLMIQLLGIALIFVWTAVLTWIILKIISYITGLRVDDETESQGLDLMSHGERGYNME